MTDTDFTKTDWMWCWEKPRDAAANIDALREFADWVDTWVSNPASSYSHAALEGLFGMTRDRLHALKARLDAAEQS